jgi:hypothetical protein
MYIDYDLRISNGQALTVTTSSTSYIDAIQAGWGADAEVYARFMIGTAIAGTAASSITFAIQIAQDTAFATVLTVVTVSKYVAQMTAKSIPLVVKLPVAMMTGQIQGDTLYSSSAATGYLPYRYVRANYTVTVSGSLTGGTVYCDFVMAEPTTIDRPL